MSSNALAAVGCFFGPLTFYMQEDPEASALVAQYQGAKNFYVVTSLRIS